MKKVVWALWLLVSVSATAAVVKSGDYSYGNSFFEASLNTVVFVEPSPDGRFLYTSQYGGTSSIHVFEIGPDGSLTLKSVVHQDELLCSPLGFRLNPSGTRLVIANQCGVTLLYKRDAATGTLSPLTYVKNGEDLPADFDRHRRATFSKDGKFIYVSSNKGIAVLQENNEALEVVQVFRHPKLLDIRGLTPGRRFMYVCSTTGGSVATLSRDETTGKLELVDIKAKGDLDATGAPIRGLDMAFDVRPNADETLLYQDSGRFGGESAINVWRIEEDGHLTLQQQILPGVDGVPEFKNGHYMELSPDGKDLFLTAFGSNSMLQFSIGSKLEYVRTYTDLLTTPADMVFTPDGKFLYVAAETAGGLVVFKKDN